MASIPHDNVLTSVQKGIPIIENIRYVYADYWIAYRLVFESREQILCSVYPTGINDRYPLYAELVGKAESPAYIIMQARASGFEEMLEDMNIRRYEKEELSPFVLFYDIQAEFVSGH